MMMMTWRNSQGVWERVFCKVGHMGIESTNECEIDLSENGSESGSNISMKMNFFLIHCSASHPISFKFYMIEFFGQKTAFLA